MHLSKELIPVLLVATLLTGCRAKPPGATESAAVNWTKHHVTVGGRSDKNPVPATPENIADGKQAFTSYCMVCHGLDGQNTGVPFAETMSPPVPSLASPRVQAYTDGQLKWIIENGIYPSGMPPIKGSLQRRRHVAHGGLHPAPSQTGQPRRTRSLRRHSKGPPRTLRYSLHGRPGVEFGLELRLPNAQMTRPIASRRTLRRSCQGESRSTNSTSKLLLRGSTSLFAGFTALRMLNGRRRTSLPSGFDSAISTA